MKRFLAIPVLCMLFSTAFVSRKGVQQMPAYPDSLRNVYLYTEGVKKMLGGDTVRARELFLATVHTDPDFAPAYYALASHNLYSSPEEGVELARKAYLLDTTNKWYMQSYGQALIYAQRYDDARNIYRKLRTEDAQNPDNYRILAALYEQGQQPFSAIAVLDSAEVRFGKIPGLSAMKRQLLISTRQLDKAVAEARELVDAVPYETENHVALAALYGLMDKDSLALAEFREALRIDSTDVAALMTLADFYSSRRNYRELLSVTKQLFASDAQPVEQKVERFRQLTSDTRFYREYYVQLNDLASMLAIHYPNDKRVVELYARHLIASGELEQALALYKLHTADMPPVRDYFDAVLEIESYLQRPDSVEKYVSKALKHFPDDARLYIARGHALSYAKQQEKAIKAYRQSLRYARTDSLKGEIWGFIGDTYYAAGEKKKSYAAYEKSLALWPDNPMVLNNYAYFLTEENRDLPRALEMSSRVAALTGNNPTYLDTQAWVLYKLGRFAEAKKIMQQAIALDSQNSHVLQVHYGDILEALGEHFMADIYWRKALENGYDAEEINRRLEKRKSD